MYDIKKPHGSRVSGGDLSRESIIDLGRTLNLPPQLEVILEQWFSSPVCVCIRITRGVFGPSRSLPPSAGESDPPGLGAGTPSGCLMELRLRAFILGARTDRHERSYRDASAFTSCLGLSLPLCCPYNGHERKH